MKCLVLPPLCSITALLIAGGSYAQSGTQLFRTDTVHDLRITIEQAAWYDTLVNWELLELDQDLRCTVTLDGEVVDSVGISMRGDASFANSPAPKKPLRLDFNTFVAGQQFDGVKSFNLNTGYPDAAYFREALTYRMLGESGLVAPRTGFAEVHMNDTLYGVYVLVERINKTFLADHYASNDGDLWKTIICDWSYQGADSTFYLMDLKERADGLSWPRFIHLIHMLDVTAWEDMHDSLGLFLDLNSLLRTYAVNAAVVGLDNITQNWWLYQEPDSARYHNLPWDYNNALPGADAHTLSEDTSVTGFWGATRLTKAIMADPVLRQHYYDVLCELRRDVFNLDHLAPIIDSAHLLLAPYVLNDTMDLVEPADFDSSYHALQTVWGLHRTVDVQGGRIDSTLALAATSCGTSGLQVPASASPLSVHPVPGNGLFFISNSSGHAIRYRVFDATGRPITDQVVPALGSCPLDLQGYADGIYLMRWSDPTTGCARLVLAR